MLFRQLFDPTTSTYTYLLADADSKEAILIDPVREQVDRDSEVLQGLGLRLVATLETHVHADHVTGGWALKRRWGSDIIVPAGTGVANADRTVDEGDEVHFGRFALVVRRTPGHTDGCTTYVTHDLKRAFTGDALLIRGSGRTDFQQGDARQLYRSVWDQILSLPDETELYPGHDYKGRTVTTVAGRRRTTRASGSSEPRTSSSRSCGT
jgi:sulfur dioxygenase